MIMQKFVALVMETVLSAAALETRVSSLIGVAAADKTQMESNAVARIWENMIACRGIENKVGHEAHSYTHSKLGA